AVFSNGSMVFRGDEDAQQPILLTDNAQPGQKFLITVRVQVAKKDTQIRVSRLLITPLPARPDPGIFRQEILAMRPIVEAFPEGQPDHRAVLDAAVKAVDLNALDRGNQQGFDSSLRQAQSKLDVLKPWVKQFTIRAAGNSHIDM